LSVAVETCPCGGALEECACGCKSPWCVEANNFVWNCQRPRTQAKRTVTPLSQVILPAQRAGNYDPRVRARLAKLAKRRRRAIAESERAGSLDSYGSDDEDEGGR
jgi:hypothetical protein